MKRRLGGTAGRDTGAISTFVAISAAAMVGLVGLVLEAGAQLRAIELADARAQEAARAATQQLDRQAVLDGRGYHVVSQDAATAAANAYLQQYGLTADRVDLTAGPTGDTVTVQFTTTYQTALLSAVDVPELKVHGNGKATLVHGITEAENG
jgi:hypothetical protein